MQLSKSIIVFRPVFNRVLKGCVLGFLAFLIHFKMKYARKYKICTLNLGKNASFGFKHPYFSWYLMLVHALTLLEFELSFSVM